MTPPRPARTASTLTPVLEIGDRVPDAHVWLTPRERVPVSDLTAEGPVLFLFYLVDWAST